VRDICRHAAAPAPRLKSSRPRPISLADIVIVNLVEDTLSRKQNHIAASCSSRQHQEEAEPEVGYYHKNWLQDPLCVGSSVTALGQETSDWSSSATQTSQRYVPRSVLEPVGEQL
jgi:hypothetical protein